MVLTRKISSSNYHSTGPNAFGKINIVTANSSSANLNNENHNTQVYANNVLIHDTSYYGYASLHLNFDIPNNQISSTTAVRHGISSIGQGTDYQHVSSISLWYPHNFNFSNYDEILFGLSHTAGQKQRITITNMLNGSLNPRMYFLDDINRTIPLVNNNNNWEAVIPPPSQTAILFSYLTSDTEIITPLSYQSKWIFYRLFITSN